MKKALQPYTQQIIESLIHRFYVVDGEFRDAIESVFIRCDHTVIVHIHHFEIGIDEHFHGLGEFLVAPPHAALLDGLFELVCGDFTFLQQFLNWKNNKNNW